MKQPVMEWRREMDCWLLRVESPLPAPQVRACVDFLKKVQGGRRLGLMPGDQRDDLDASVRALEEGRVQQWAAGPNMNGKGEIAAFRSERGTGKTTIDLGA
jgi:hypothetical protein